jgi:hypothetical protein
MEENIRFKQIATWVKSKATQNSSSLKFYYGVADALEIASIEYKHKINKLKINSSPQLLKIKSNRKNNPRK